MRQAAAAGPHRVLVLAALLVVAGCYRYVPAESDAVRIGDRVRLEVTREGFTALPPLPEVDGLRLAGTLMRSGGGTWIVRIPTATDVEGVRSRSLGQDVPIRTRDIVGLEARRLSPRRTMLSVGGGVAGLIGMLITLGDGIPNPELPPRDREVELGSGYE